MLEQESAEKGGLVCKPPEEVLAEVRPGVDS